MLTRFPFNTFFDLWSLHLWCHSYILILSCLHLFSMSSSNWESYILPFCLSLSFPENWCVTSVDPPCSTMYEWWTHASVVSHTARSCNCVENYKFTSWEQPQQWNGENGEWKRNDSLWCIHVCFYGVLPLSEWHQHQKPLSKAVVKRSLSLYGAVIKGRQFSKKIEHCKNEMNPHQSF